MSPQAGFVLKDEIYPRLCSAVPRSVLCVGQEDPQELIQDGITMAAKMIDRVERQGKPESTPAPLDEGDGVEKGDDVAEVDLEAVESVLIANDDALLVASKIVPAERGYTIEQLQNHEESAWNAASERFLKIAVYKYRDVVSFYLPGVDEEDARSAVGEIVPDLRKTISKYSSLPELEAAFRTALCRDILSLQRKYLAQMRGGGRVVVTSELQGLEQTDEVVEESSDLGDEKAPSTLEGKLNPEFSGWTAHSIASGSSAADQVDRLKLMSEAMNEMEPAESQMIRWSFIDGLKQREIAEKLGKNTKQIGSELSRAKEKLKKLVNEKMLVERKNLL